MKLSDLSPTITNTSLSFDCPKCRAPHRISIEITRGPPGNGRWKISGHDASRVPFHECLTLEPSIMSAHHGRSKDARLKGTRALQICGGHWNVINGIVIDA